MKSLARITFAVFALWFATGGAVAAAQEPGTISGMDKFLGNHAQYFKLQPFHIPVIRNGRIGTQVSMNITIETFGLEDKDKVMALRRRLQDAFLRDLHGVIAVRHGNGRPYVAASVKIRLTRLANNIVGEGVVKAILIETSQHMPLNR